jgi:hypothetical protein
MAQTRQQSNETHSITNKKLIKKLKNKEKHNINFEKIIMQNKISSTSTTKNILIASHNLILFYIIFTSLGRNVE